MNKLSNKGLTFVELIVSFMIVSVAVIYFYQTLYTVEKLYVAARENTNEFTIKNYVSRLIDKRLDKSYAIDDICDKVKLVGVSSCSISLPDPINTNSINTFDVEFKYKNKNISYKLYKYVRQIDGEPSSSNGIINFNSLDFSYNITTSPAEYGYVWKNFSGFKGNEDSMTARPNALFVITSSYKGTNTSLILKNDTINNYSNATFNIALGSDCGGQVTNTTTISFISDENDSTVDTKEIVQPGSTNGSMFIDQKPVSLNINNKTGYFKIDVKHDDVYEACTVYTAVDKIELK